MSDVTERSWIKTALELGPLLVFFGAYFYFRNDTIELFGQVFEGLVIATLVFIPVIVLATLVLWAVTGKLSPMQVLTTFLVLVLGGITIWFNDPQFIKMKPSLLYLAFSAILVFGVWTDRLYLETLLGDAIPMYWEGWMILTRRVVVLFAALAILNEVIWRNLSEDIWITFKTFGLPILTVIFFVLQMRLFSIYDNSDDFE